MFFSVVKITDGFMYLSFINFFISFNSTAAFLVTMRCHNLQPRLRFHFKEFTNCW